MHLCIAYTGASWVGTQGGHSLIFFRRTLRFKSHDVITHMRSLYKVLKFPKIFWLTPPYVYVLSDPPLGSSQVRDNESIDGSVAWLPHTGNDSFLFNWQAIGNLITEFSNRHRLLFCRGPSISYLVPKILFASFLRCFNFLCTFCFLKVMDYMLTK